MEASSISFFDAVKKGNLAAVKAILEQDPGLVHARDADQLSAVLAAVYYQQPAVADLLIQAGASLNLFEACAAGQSSIVRKLLDEAPAQVNDWAADGFQPLGLACFFGHTSIVDLLLSRGAAVNSPSRNGLKVQPLNSAVAGQHLEIAQMLLNHGADPNASQGENFTPLHGAAQNGQIEMIRILLSHGANPQSTSANGKRPYEIAIESGHSEAANLLK